MHNATAELEELAEESAATAPETTVDGLGDGASMREKLASIDKIPRNDPFEQSAASESSVDVLASCHPCYFHVRIYGEADYFMINDLKTKATAYFHPVSWIVSKKNSLWAQLRNSIQHTPTIGS
ncbi:hypothetical protein N7524_011847 [Penicillium chrysogenum]|nr:hypothetical protein N7524_011847 [Penicillium chrysogenum]